MAKLAEKYGNVHPIMGLLIDEIKSLKVIRKWDFEAFKDLSMKVNDFYEKLMLMGKREDAENSYVLKEIESKFSTEDYQKWLESLGDDVDNRTVRDLVIWLDKQTHIRRITHGNVAKYIRNAETGDFKVSRKSAICKQTGESNKVPYNILVVISNGIYLV